jgi:benzodiazapine receptor
MFNAALSESPGQRRRVTNASVLILLTFVMTTLGVGLLGASVTELNGTDWYTSIAKPSFTPPNWLFGSVWIVLYVLTGISAWRVWRLRGLRCRFIAYWGLQLAFNFAWPLIFFDLHSIVGAFIEIAILLLLILRTIVAFSAVDRIAGFLLVPYFCWTAFAAILNAMIWGLNI